MGRSDESEEDEDELEDEEEDELDDELDELDNASAFVSSISLLSAVTTMKWRK